MARLKMLGSRIQTLDTRIAKPLPTMIDPAYSKAPHRQWRKIVRERAGGRCQHPGCGIAERTMYADHIVEIQDDPTRALDPTNGQLLCSKHHVLKTAAERAKRMRR